MNDNKRRQETIGESELEEKGKELKVCRDSALSNGGRKTEMGEGVR